MPTAWRIVKSRRTAEAFDGEGASLYGGRWNRSGTRVVYTADSAALAVLEVLTHLKASQFLASYSLIPVTFKESLVTVIDAKRLSANWRAYPAPVETAEIGDRWVGEQASAVLKVPSVIVPMESNFLINPTHPQFKSVSVGSPVPFVFDARLKA